MAKKKPARKPTKRASKPKPSAKAFKAKANELGMSEMAGDAFTLADPGEVRRRHRCHSAPGFANQGLALEEKLIIIDSVLSKMTASMSCEDIDVLMLHVTCWASELSAVHDAVPDDKIQDAKILFPTDPMLRLLHEIGQFQARSSLNDDAAVDYLIMRMHGNAHRQPMVLH